MPISDLTGTKWIIKNDPTISPLNTDTNYQFEVDFIVDASDYLSDPTLNQLECWNLYMSALEPVGGGDPMLGIDYINNISNISPAYDEPTGWEDQKLRTIEITGGTDATNAELIAWLEANATQQTPVQPSSGGMYFGTLGISKIFMGNSEVSKIYLGDALVYEGVSIPDNALLTADNTYLVDSTGGYLLTTEI